MSKPNEHPAGYSLSDPYSSYASLDEVTRAKKANKIIRVLQKQRDLSSCDLLDIGTGSGHIIHLIAKHCQSATSVNLEDERVVREGYTFRVVHDVTLPFDNEAFDVVISNQVIEHIPPQELHLTEIHRVLRKGGIAYLATPSKFTVMEPHFHLPFLSWLPRPLANCYVKLFQHERCDIYPLTYSRLKRLTAGYFLAEDMSLKILKNPKDYGLDMYTWLHPVLKATPLFLLKLLHPFLPSFIVILHKQ